VTTKKAEIGESERDAEPRPYGTIEASQHAIKPGYSLITKKPPPPEAGRGLRSFFRPIASQYLAATPFTKSSPAIATPVLKNLTVVLYE